MQQLEVINEFLDTKSIVILENNEQTPTIYFVSKQPFCESEGQNVIEEIEKNPEKGLIMTNDKYKKYRIELPIDRNITTGYSVDVISPATQHDIEKNKPQKYELFTETPQIFNSITLPFINSIPPSEFQWIYNILNGTAEQDNVLINDNDYVSLLDMKWDRQNLNQVYGLVLVRDHSIHSLRALNQNHIQLLERIEKTTTKVLTNNYGLKENEIITFVHYIPSFWHFHIHFCTIHSPLFQSLNSVIGRAIPLIDIIQNLKMKGNYYQTINIGLRLNTVHPLYKLFKSN
ncbi:scavenger mRNA-decapping enzyme DcpS, putative [Entamoeba dispar SAW760]|uniref:Scavenger mRNA-decapping enzyme DcpS, putative n=1 Tax=Entamoeba dispar (strain ATCC PRA-260 / SAW760) TaxID=370354 RepID=B0ETX0_ENTDS|nr:scavenger mRNA-decapping enzyme DcpS, putative [Entamoeba dispar SAW760]EDR22058.1 scavenger mRNA-decapping enzyme DcpS, putative [Entamoeba dispar SAW760]|eukprot:EDR22058.1 scavenger mRNA-decapping enzyme DcpS, putative [Entamoeba dispar SAW760]